MTLPSPYAIPLYPSALNTRSLVGCRPPCVLPFSPCSKGTGVQKGCLGTREDQRSVLPVPHLVSCCWEHLLAAAAAGGEAVQHSHKSGAQSSCFKFRVFQVVYIMPTGTTICQRTHTEIDRDLLWRALAEALAQLGKQLPSRSPCLLPSQGRCQGYRSGVPSGHDIPSPAAAGTAGEFVKADRLLGVRGREAQQRADERSRPGHGAAGREPSRALPLLPVSRHALARGSSRSRSPSPLWRQTQSNRKHFHTAIGRGLPLLIGGWERGCVTAKTGVKSPSWHTPAPARAHSKPSHSPGARSRAHVSS